MTKSIRPGDVVWAKLKGYRWWPAKIQNENELASNVLAQKRSRSSGHLPVYFYGSLDYAWIPKEMLLEFDENYEKNAANPSCPKLFKRALEEVDCERKGLPMPGKATRGKASAKPIPKATVKRGRSRAKEVVEKTAEQIIKESGLVDLSDDVIATPKRGRGRPPKKSKPTSTTSKHFSETLKRAMPLDKEAGGSTKRGRKPKAAAVEKRVSPRTLKEMKGESQQQPNENEKGPLSIEQAVDNSISQEVASAQAETKTVEPTELWTLRHQLQRVCLKERFESVDAAAAALKKAEEYPMTPEILKTSKILKVLRHIIRLGANVVPENLMPRFQSLNRRFKALVDLIQDPAPSKFGITTEEIPQKPKQVPKDTSSALLNGSALTATIASPLKEIVDPSKSNHPDLEPQPSSLKQTHNFIETGSQS